MVHWEDWSLPNPVLISRLIQLSKTLDSRASNLADPNQCQEEEGYTN
jgi:hypothetical protein